MDFTTTNESVLEEMALEQTFQPELHDFVVVEISRGIIVLVVAR